MDIYAFHALFIRIYATNSFFLLKIQRKVNLQVIQQDIRFISFNTLHILSVSLRYVSRRKIYLDTSQHFGTRFTLSSNPKKISIL